VHVDVFAPVDGGDEAISFGIVEPLDCSLEGEREVDEAGGEEEFGEVHVCLSALVAVGGGCSCALGMMVGSCVYQRCDAMARREVEGMCGKVLRFYA
jgi:hypothetical protein